MKIIEQNNVFLSDGVMVRMNVGKYPNYLATWLYSLR
jgi:hypothetical protein